MMTRILIVSLILSAFSAISARADTFGSGENQFTLPMVTIGSPGNAPDTTGAPNPAGAVDYVYRIGRFEVPTEAVTKANAASLAAGDPLAIGVNNRDPLQPATGVSWFDAARFVNWLNEEKGAPAAYHFDASGDFQLWTPADPGYDPENPFRNALARYFLPSVNEWYKAAYYDPATGQYFDFATGSNDDPIAVASGTDPGTAVWNQTVGPADVSLAGGASPFGTVGQSGNVFEWEETALDLRNDDIDERRGFRGGEYFPAGTIFPLTAQARDGVLPDSTPRSAGIRVASVVPEPSTSILIFGLISRLTWLRSRRSRSK